MKISPAARLAVVTLLLTAAALYLARATTAEVLPDRESLASLPMQIDGAIGRREPDFSPEIMAILGVDDYAFRTYNKPGELPVGLYIGYYFSQRQGDTIHSPLNCLPGAGWAPLEQGRASLSVRRSTSSAAHETIQVNRVIIGKGLERQFVYYWYQSRDRVVASEYWGKIYTVLDAVKYRRSDAAIVRVVVPIPPETATNIAEKQASRFVTSLFPLLSRHIPA